MQIKGLGRCLRKVWELGLSGACPMRSFLLLLKDEVGLVKKKATGALNTNSANETKIKHAKRGFSLNLMRTRNIGTKGKGTSKMTLKLSTFSNTRRDTRVANGGIFKGFFSLSV
jgi:hypothetical protein